MYGHFYSAELLSQRIKDNSSKSGKKLTMNRSTVEQTKFKLKTLSNWSSRRRADHRGSESYGTAVGANLAIDREQTERVKERSQFSHGIEIAFNVRSQGVVTKTRNYC